MGDVTRDQFGNPQSDSIQQRLLQMSGGHPAAVQQLLQSRFGSDPGMMMRIMQSMGGGMPQPGMPRPQAAGAPLQLPGQEGSFDQAPGGFAHPGPPPPPPQMDFDRTFAGLGVPEGTPGIEHLQGGGFSMGPRPQPTDIITMLRALIGGSSPAQAGGDIAPVPQIHSAPPGMDMPSYTQMLAPPAGPPQPPPQPFPPASGMPMPQAPGLRPQPGPMPRPMAASGPLQLPGQSAGPPPPAAQPMQRPSPSWQSLPGWLGLP